MLDRASKAVFHALARSRALQRAASRYGMAGSRSFARRFIAGETLGEAIEAARAVEAHGLALTLDYLGESVTSRAAAEAATGEYVRLIAEIVTSGIERNLSLKLTQLGLDIDRQLARDHLRCILEPARREGFFVRIDMENSPYVEATLELFDDLWREGFRNVGVVLQSALRRSEDDLARLNRLGARVRLVKGAYKEPAAVAYQSRREVDAAFARMQRTLLHDGTFPALATHDEALIDEARRVAAAAGLARDRFEFQMLYGVRRDLQQALCRDGYRVRVYVPFGRQWFPYFMRRLGERPANVGFVVRSLLQER